MWELLTLPLKIIFKVALNDGVFPDDWKKGNIVPAHKKDIKTMLTNYRPISFLPLFAKILEITIFISIFEYFNLKINFSKFFSLVFFQTILALRSF